MPLRSGNSAIRVEAEIGRRRLQRVLPVERRHEPRELQLVEVQVVVVDAEARSDHGLVVRVVGDADARPEVVQVLLQDARRIEAVLVDDERHELRRADSTAPCGRRSCRWPRRTIPRSVRLVPRREVFPTQSHLHRHLRRDLPVVVDERREGRRPVGRARAAERAGARRAVAEQEVADRIAGELAVEREAAARRHFGEVLEVAELRLQAEADVVAPFTQLVAFDTLKMFSVAPCVMPPSPFPLKPVIVKPGRP